tara:strand:- start:255 stop:434 length:180 start_codon:yes stop_codon:yes gene_type:complete
MIYIKEPTKGQKVTLNHPLGQRTYLIDDKIKSIDDCMMQFKKCLGLKTLRLLDVYVQVS